MFWRTLGRMILVVFAFLIAALAAGFVLVTLGMEQATQAMHGRDVLADNIDSVFDLLRTAARLLSAMTIIPALALIVIGEVARIRGALFYIVGGGAALAAIPLLARLGQAGDAMPALILWQVFATAGFAGGFVYWLLAGRRA